ncbi:erythromycin esterase family protein [Nonomuraea typhae]|uniref:erythromycin esterase family protein n=1 Tax=Nonomuraea typhae TaxID=2603600 RepID=UPI0012FBFCC3|nr:erythromycin esterase family protein [Nonomuraea typhae]
MHHDLGAAVLRLTGQRRMLGLGEPTHGVEDYLLLRNEIFRYLVEEAGYRSIALESCCLNGLTADAYVAGADLGIEEAADAGFSHGFGDAAANRELLDWMRAYNRGRGEDERLRWYGFDGPLEITGAASPRRALTALRDYLAAHLELPPPPGAAGLDRLVGDDGRWDNLEAMMDGAKSIGRSQEAVQLRLLADDLAGYLESETPQLIARTSRQEWWRACLYARTATGLLRYHAAMADESPARMGRMMALRDAMMAANLLAIDENEAARGPVLVFAANAHLQRERSSVNLWEGRVEWWSAGALAAARLGEAYAFVATTAGTGPELEEPAPDTLEGVLSARPGDRMVVDVKELDRAELSRRVVTTHRFAPFDPAHEPDALIFLRDAR